MGRRLKAMWKAFEAYQKKRADYMILQMMSERELRDLGIGKSQIREIVYGEGK